jgi:hypothetical protein
VQDVNAVVVFSRNRDLRCYLCPWAVSFVRHNGSRRALLSKNSHQLNLTLVGAISGTPTACTAELELGGGALADNVIVKLARTPGDCKKLLHEYSVYVHLAGAGVPGIAKTLGLFEHTGLHGLLTNIVFVMLDAGISLADWRKARKRKPPLTDSQR